MNAQRQKVNIIFFNITYFCFLVSKDLEESDALGFFESLEHEKAQAEMAKLLKKKKKYPVAPDGKIFLSLNNISSPS